MPQQCYCEIQDYKIIHKIATGGCADILLAKKAGKYLVIKKIKDNFIDEPEFLEMLQNEAQISINLHHPNVLSVFELTNQDNLHFIAMEYMDAYDCYTLLAKFSKNEEHIPFNITAYIIEQAALGLHCAHELKDSKGTNLDLVHRDISPQNILFNREGDIKISDFGIAKTTSSSEHTSQGFIKGKFNYMSPEQAWGDKLDRRSDIFSLGVVMYEALTSKPLYPDSSTAAVIENARIANFIHPQKLQPDIPQQLINILLKCLDIDKKLRFQTMADLAYALRAYLLTEAPDINKETFAKYLHANLINNPATLPKWNSQNYYTKSNIDTYIDSDKTEVITDTIKNEILGESINESPEILEKIRQRTPFPKEPEAEKLSDKYYKISKISLLIVIAILIIALIILSMLYLLI